MRANSPGLVPPGIGHAPDLNSLPYAERMREHRRCIQAILPVSGSEGVSAYVAAYPEAGKIRHRSQHRAYLSKPPGYADALAAMVALWFDSSAALSATNKADVARLNAKLGTTFPPANHFNCRLSMKCRDKLATVFQRNGAHLDTKHIDSMSKVRKAVAAAKAAQRPGHIAFGTIGHRTSSTLTIGQRVFQIERNGQRECIRPRINGSKRRLYLDDVLWLAGLLSDGAGEGVSPDLLRSKLIERAYLPEAGQDCPTGEVTHDRLGLPQSDSSQSLPDRIRKLAASRQPPEPAAHTAGTDLLAII